MFNDFNAGVNIELYKIILDDTGNTAKIKENIAQLKLKAKHDCEGMEKARRAERELMNAAMGDSQSGTHDMSGSVQRLGSIHGTPEKSSSGVIMSYKSNTRNPGQPNILLEDGHVGIQKGDLDRASRRGSREAQGQQPMIPQNQIKLQNLLEFSTPMDFMPEVGVENLQDMLAQSQFEMPKSDKDYKLSQFQLIKVCKMLLHKINIQNAKNEIKHKETGDHYTKLYDSLHEKLKASVQEL